MSRYDKVILKFGNGVLNAVLCGDIDHHTSELIRIDIENAIVEYDPFLLVMDFKNVGFMDSSGIGLILGRYRTLVKLRKKKMEVINIPVKIRRVFELSGLRSLGILK